MSLNGLNKKKKDILITGFPGVGKTTLIKRIVSEIRHLNPVGFYTEEIREGGERKGFWLVDLNGRRSILAHREIKSKYRVGPYGVDIEGFEAFISNLPFFSPSIHLIIIDEIGKMECFSEKFKIFLNRIINSEKFLIATISMKGSGLISEIKRRDDIILFKLTLDNRDYLLNDILKEINIAFSKKPF